MNGISCERLEFPQNGGYVHGGSVIQKFEKC